MSMHMCLLVDKTQERISEVFPAPSEYIQGSLARTESIISAGNPEILSDFACLAHNHCMLF